MPDYPTRKAFSPHDLTPACLRASWHDRRDADADLHHDLAQIATLSGKPANLEIYRTIFRKWCALAVEDIEKRVRPAGHGDWRRVIGTARERLLVSMVTGPTPQAIRWRIRRREEWKLRSRHTAAVRLAMCDAQDDHLGVADVVEKIARYVRADHELLRDQVARVRLFRRLVKLPPLSAQAQDFRRYIARRDALRAEREARLAKEEAARLREMPLKEEHVVLSMDKEVGLPVEAPIPAGHVIVHRCSLDMTKLSTSSSDRAVVRDRMRIELAAPKRVAGPVTIDRVDTVFAETFAISPWVPGALEYLRQGALDSLDEGRGFTLPPVLLVGPPGCGKTHLAMTLARIAELASVRLEGSTMCGAFSIGGSDFQWGHSHPGEPVARIHASGTANPLIVVDEIEKVSTGGTGGDPRTALLPLLQRSTAESYRCPYLQDQIDLSRISWILTANSLAGLPAPLLDRVTVFEVGYPTGADLLATVRRALGDLAVDESVIAAVVDGIESGRMTLRALDRIKARLRAVNRQPVLH
ncbi:AAA family ATPase [Cereibacter johrii]|uniref:AAA family ATPase n=1 Tax=Cereibacter johrii TaxID=445629 RepID=UPI002B25D86A|nr:AAA family ATPase [Cereibacter johrii]MEA5159955.1 AAA family ATPase [Cereibacter johrii]